MKDISKIIVEQVENYNENLENKVDTSKGTDTILFSVGGVLDSVDFVSLMVKLHTVRNL